MSNTKRTGSWTTMAYLAFCGIVVGTIIHFHPALTATSPPAPIENAKHEVNNPPDPPAWRAFLEDEVNRSATLARWQVFAAAPWAKIPDPMRVHVEGIVTPADRAGLVVLDELNLARLAHGQPPLNYAVSSEAGRLNTDIQTRSKLTVLLVRSPKPGLRPEPLTGNLVAFLFEKSLAAYADSEPVNVTADVRAELECYCTAKRAGNLAAEWGRR